MKMKTGKKPSGKKPALKGTKQEQLVLTKSVGLQAQQDAEKKESKKDDSDRSDVEAYSDSESPGECGKESQVILNSVGGLLSRFSGAVASVTESTSSMVLE